jgi:hypothetical protein
MVLLPNTSRADSISAENDLYFDLAHSKRFYLYYDPVSALTFSGTLPDKGNIMNILSDVYMEYVQWNRQPPFSLIGAFSPRSIDTLILGGCTADEFQLYFYKDGVYVGGGLPVQIDRRLAPAASALDVTDQNIFIYHFPPITADAFSFDITAGTSPIALHKLYLGGRASIRLPSSYEYPLVGKGQGKLTDIGVAYGYKMDTSRRLKAHWDFIDDTDRRQVERMLDAVQNVQPCFIKPCAADEYIPPLFGVFQQEMGNKKKADRWLWDGLDLEFTQVT